MADHIHIGSRREGKEKRKETTEGLVYDVRRQRRAKVHSREWYIEHLGWKAGEEDEKGRDVKRTPTRH